jgi:hypothetical protein
MPQVGFEPTIPVFERAKMVYALDRAANVIGSKSNHRLEFRPFPLPSRAFPIRNPTVIPPFDVTQSELVAESLK